MNDPENKMAGNSIKYQWKIFYQLFLEPWFVLIAIVSIVTIIYSYNTTDKSLSLYLNIIACFLTSIAGAICYDRYTQINGNTVLVKKGKGAVRNLFLLMDRIRNISLRSKETTDNEEIRNLLGFIEKDVYNSIQEWTDVIPTIADVDQYSIIVLEKEREIKKIENRLSEVEIANKQLAVQANEATSLRGEKDILKREKEELLEKLNNFESELNKFKQARDTAIIASSTFASTSAQSPFFVDRTKVGVARKSTSRDKITGRFLNDERLHSCVQDTPELK